MESHLNSTSIEEVRREALAHHAELPLDRRHITGFNTGGFPGNFAWVFMVIYIDSWGSSGDFI